MKPIVPVALFAYARPNHLQRTLAGLKRNNVPVVYAFSDGPKHSDIEPSVNQVRQILRDINWCELRLIERENNLGLGKSIRSGVSEVLNEYDRLIVVEDDVVLRPGAYDYTVKALKRYENEPDVMSISMWSHPMIVQDKNAPGFFSRRFVCWGWGTYRQYWTKYQGTPLELYQRCMKQGIDVLSWGKDLKWQVDHAEERNLWYVGYALTHLLHEKISFFPNESLVVNIGCDGTGENMGLDTKGENVELIDIPVNIPKTWPHVSVSSGLEDNFAQYFNPQEKSLRQCLINVVAKIRNKIVT